MANTSILEAIALVVGLGGLVTAVLRAREPGTFPLATLARRWFLGAPPPAFLLIGAGAGIASVVIVPLIGVLRGWARITPAVPLSGHWVGMAIAAVAVKAAFVVFEELIFRGALVSELRRWVGPAAAIGLSALAFAVAHSDRSPIDMAVLFADGIGFALAFVMTGSLWVPVVWHLSKNVSVWLFLGSGTIDLTHGLFDFQQVGSGWAIGSTASAGLLDLAVTTLIVGLVAWSLRRYRTAQVEAV